MEDRRQKQEDTAAAHVLDWINFYHRGDASKILKDDKTLEGFLSSAEYPGSMIKKSIQEKVLKFKEKSGEEIMRDCIKKYSYSGDHVEGRRYLLRAAGFPSDCSYECYSISEGGIGNVLLYLVRDTAHLISKSTYTLVVLRCDIDSLDGLRVISDIPTVFFSIRGELFTYSATNEVLDMKVRQSFSKLCMVFRNNYYEEPLALDFGLTVRNFIRIRHHANEKPLTGDTVKGTAVDITCGRVTDAWRRGKHMSAQFCSLAGGKDAFKTPSLAMTHVQAFLEKLASIHDSKKSSQIKSWLYYSGLGKRKKPKEYGKFDLSNVFTSEY